MLGEGMEIIGLHKDHAAVTAALSVHPTECLLDIAGQ